MNRKHLYHFQKNIIIILLISLIAGLTACSFSSSGSASNTRTVQTKSKRVKETEREIEGTDPEFEKEDTTMSNVHMNEDMRIHEKKHILDELLMKDQSMHTNNDVYSSIIKAYKDFEDSGFMTYDENVIGDSFLAIGKDWGPSNAGLGIDIYSVTLQYSLLDISRDGVPELFISAVGQYVADHIYGIYTIKNGEPVSALQIDNSRSHFMILEDHTIHSSWGHMGYYEADFYRFENGTDMRLVDSVSKHDADILQEEDTETNEEEYMRIINKYPTENTIALNWQPLAAWGESFISYRDAYIRILNDQKNDILNFTGTLGITENYITGGAIALENVYGDALPELLYVKAVSSEDNLSGRAQLNIWTYENSQPQLIFVMALDMADKGNDAVFTDREGNIYIYSKQYYSHRGNVSHSFTQYDLNGTSYMSGIDACSLRNSGEELDNGSGYDRKEYNKRVTSILNSLDLMIFSFGIYDSDRSLEFWDTYNEPLWGAYVADQDSRITFEQAFSILK